jgi:hypothetical protein
MDERLVCEWVVFFPCDNSHASLFVCVSCSLLCHCRRHYFGRMRQ